MQRADHDLAFLFQFENIAWYENGAVRILDRRIYPARKSLARAIRIRKCKAITDMVTQSYGPFHAAAMGMALAATNAAKRRRRSSWPPEAAADVIANARPTTARKMRTWTDDCERDARAAVQAGKNACDAIMAARSRSFPAGMTGSTGKRVSFWKKSRKIQRS
jgi:methylthioribose-1-phosphate isomerase